MRDILNISKELFEKWNINNITYCHWKSNEHLYEGLVGETDLDVLVRFEEKEAAELYLSECGFLKFVPQYGSVYDMVSDWIGCDKNTGRMIHIHLHYKMITGHKGLKEYDLPWTEVALKTRRIHQEFPVYVVDPNLEVLILVSRICLKATANRVIKSKLQKFRLSTSDIAEFSYLRSLIDRERVLNIANDYFGNDSETITDIALSKDNDFKWFRSGRRIVLNHLSRFNRYGVSLLFKRPYFNLILKLRLGWKKLSGATIITKKTREKGSIIAFVGQDGAGKSTVSNEVLKWLSWKIDARKYYLGSGEHYHSWQKSLRTKIHKRSGFAGIINSILVVSDLKRIAKVTYKKIKAAEKYASKGGIALFDRYPQLQYPGINDGPKIRVSMQDKRVPSVLKRLLLCYAGSEEKYILKATRIQPDLVFKMTLEPEESLRRKPEENIEKIKQKHDIVNCLKFDKSKVVFIDAAQDYEEEIRTIHCLIWNYLLDRG